MTYLLKPLMTQLDNGSSTAGNDCAVETIINVTRLVSRGRVLGSLTRHNQAPTVHHIRAIAGEQRDGLLFKTQTLPVYHSSWWLGEFRRAGLKVPHVDYFDGIGSERLGWGHVIRRLKSGWIAHLPIDYSVYRHSVGGNQVGSLSFGDGHSIAVANPRKMGPHRWLYVDVGDSLCDGRVRWAVGGIHRYPDGWRTVRLMDLRRAAGAWGANPAGAGHAYAIFVKEDR